MSSQDAITLFRRAAFSDHVWSTISNQPSPRLIKAASPVFAYGAGDLPSYGLPEMFEIIDQIEQASGLSIVDMKQQDYRASFLVFWADSIEEDALGRNKHVTKYFYMGRKDYRNSLLNDLRDSPKCLQRSIHHQGRIKGTLVYLDNDVEKEFALRCIVRNLLFHIGLVGVLEMETQDKESVLRKDRDTWSLTMDILIVLRIFGNPRIRRGADEFETEKAIRELRELR